MFEGGGSKSVTSSHRCLGAPDNIPDHETLACKAGEMAFIPWGYVPLLLVDPLNKIDNDALAVVLFIWFRSC